MISNKNVREVRETMDEDVPGLKVVKPMHDNSIQLVVTWTDVRRQC